MIRIEQRHRIEKGVGFGWSDWGPFDPADTALSLETVTKALMEAANPDCQFVTLSLNFSPFDPSWGWQYRGKQV